MTRTATNLAPFKFDAADPLMMVFMLPPAVPSDFCFGGGYDVPFRLVDWFRNEPHPLSNPPRAASLEELRNFIREKRYYRPDLNFLVLGRDGTTFLVDPP